MNERGFFTIVGLCLLLVASIMIRGVQEVDANYFYEESNFSAEQELQNAADSALAEAIEIALSEDYTQKYKNDAVEIPVKQQNDSDISTTVLARYGFIYQFTVTSYSGSTVKYKDNGYLRGLMLISVASRDDERIGGKMYRRALAYVLNDDKKTIHYLNHTNQKLAN